MWPSWLASEVGFRLRVPTAVEFVLVAGCDQVVFHLHFTVGELRHEVVEFGSAVLVFGPFGGFHMRGDSKRTPCVDGWG